MSEDQEEREAREDAVLALTELEALKQVLAQDGVHECLAEVGDPRAALNALTDATLAVHGDELKAAASVRRSRLHDLDGDTLAP